MHIISISPFVLLSSKRLQPHILACAQERLPLGDKLVIFALDSIHLLQAYFLFFSNGNDDDDSQFDMGDFDCEGLDTIIASPVLWVTGDVDNDASLTALQRFCKGDSSVLLGTYESCGRCHCVPEANGVILFDDGPSHRAVMQVHEAGINYSTLTHMYHCRLELHA